MAAFADRTAAGRALARRLVDVAGTDPAVLGLSRGGVVVAAQVAAALAVPLGVLVVRKVGAPGRRETAVGAIAEDGPTVWDLDLLGRLGLAPADMEPAAAAERAELTRQRRALRGGAARPDLPGQGPVVVVDDGLATGSTAVAAVRWVREAVARPVVLAVPVASAGGVRRLAREVDRVIAVLEPEAFRAVSCYYDDFHQVGDDEVMAALHGHL